MSLTDSEAIVKQFLEAMEFTVDIIAKTQGEKRADFRVKDNDHSYIVEVKSKDYNEDFATQVRSGKVASRKEYLGNKGTIAGQIRDAIDQIRETPRSSNEFCLLALVGAEDAADDHMQQFEATLYGTSNIVQERDGQHVLIPCFYFTFNEFFKARDVEAAILFGDNKLKLCINSLSDRRYDFQHTRLWKIFAEHDAIADPDSLEKEQAGYIADCDYDRREVHLIEQFIQNKYKIPHRIMSVNFTHHRSRIFIPDKNDD